MCRAVYGACDRIRWRLFFTTTVIGSHNSVGPNTVACNLYNGIVESAVEITITIDIDVDRQKTYYLSKVR